MRTLRSNHSQWGTVKASLAMQHSQCSSVLFSPAPSLNHFVHPFTSAVIPPPGPHLLQLVAMLLQPPRLKATCLCHAPPLAPGVNTSPHPPAPASCAAPPASASSPLALSPQAPPTPPAPASCAAPLASASPPHAEPPSPQSRGPCVPSPLASWRPGDNRGRGLRRGRGTASMRGLGRTRQRDKGRVTMECYLCAEGSASHIEEQVE